MRNKALDNRPENPVELLLIRIGHHLWRSGKRKEWPFEAVSSGLKDVWEAKEAIRAPLRTKWLESLNNRRERFAEVRHEGFKKAA